MHVCKKDNDDDDTTCMHAKKDNDDDVTHMHANLELNKVINIKPSIYIKLVLHHCFYDKIFETRPHLSIFAKILKVFSLLQNI